MTNAGVHHLAILGEFDLCPDNLERLQAGVADQADEVRGAPNQVAGLAEDFSVQGFGRRVIVGVGDAVGVGEYVGVDVAVGVGVIVLVGVAV